MKFFLGLHMPSHMERAELPVCVSYGRLRHRKTLPTPRVPVFLDSRGFSEIAQHGQYTFSHREYCSFVERCRDEWGGWLAHASIMDWMCEPMMMAKTRKTVAEHQQLTVNSYLILNGMNGELPWVPVLQGYTVDDYHRCVDLYERSSMVDLASLPLVGLGSVCRRQGMQEAAAIVKSLYARGLKNLHGFGFKVTGLVSKGLRLCRYLESADSMAWSAAGRKAWQQDGVRLCVGTHKGGCGNCLVWAEQWREKLMARCELAENSGTQELLF